MRVQVGSYTADGVDGLLVDFAQTTPDGVAFQPDIVLVKGAGATNMVCRTATMPFDLTKDLVAATALERNLILEFTPIGFRVGTDARVNTAATVYHFLAIQQGPNDCKVFQYEGDGGTDRVLSGVGFTPACMFVLPSTAALSTFRWPNHSSTNSQTLTTAQAAGGIEAFTTDGAQVDSGGGRVNTTGVTYHAFCLAEVSTFFNGITYTGTGVDGLAVSGVGFQPSFLLVKRVASTAVAAMRGVDHAGDASALVNAANAADIIQTFETDGFTVGTHASVNAAVAYYALAFAAGSSSSSLTVALSNRDITVNLDEHTYHGLNFGGSFGDPEITRQWSPVWGRGHHPLGGVSYGNRVIDLPIRITAAALDNWAQRSRNIHLILRDAERYAASQGREGLPATLWVQLNGMTNEVIYDVLAGDLRDSALVNPAMTVTTAPRVMEVPLSLTVKPFGRPQNPHSEVSAALTNGSGTFTLATLAKGDVPAPQRLTFTGNDPYQRVIIGRKSRGNLANTTFVLECEPGTFTGYTVAASGTKNGSATALATAHGASALRILSSAAAASTGTESLEMTWTLTSNVIDWYGRYRAYMRMSVPFQTSDTILNLKYGGASGDSIANANVTPGSGAGGPTLIDLGLLNIPGRLEAPGIAPAQYKFTLRMRNGANATNATNAVADCLYLIPIDEFFADVQLSAQATSGDKLVLDSLMDVPGAYLKSASGLEPESVVYNQYSGMAVEPRKTNRWDVLALRGTNISATGSLGTTDTFTLQSDYLALYNRFYATNAS